MASTKSTATVATWNGHKFKVSSKLIYALNDLSLKGSAETKEKEKNGHKYIEKKSTKPYEVSFTVQLNRMLGVKKVKDEAIKWLKEARNGTQDYIYLTGKKLIACKFMLTDASISGTTILPNGDWMACEIKCTFKQSSLLDGETTQKKSSHHHSSSKSRKSGTSKTKGTSYDDVDVVSGPAPKVSSTKTTIAKAVSVVTKTIAKAKSASKSTSTSSTSSKSYPKLGSIPGR